MQFISSSPAFPRLFVVAALASAPIHAQSTQGFDLGYLSAAQSQQHNGFGGSIVLDGDRMIVGAPASSSVQEAVHVLERQGATWLETDGLTVAPGSPSLSSKKLFGHAVDLEGDRLIVGAPALSSTYSSLPGSVSIFYRFPSGDWMETHELQPNFPQPSGRFGFSVALDGDIALVGAPYHDLPGAEDAGIVYVFERQPPNGWIEVGRIEAPTPQEHDLFGYGLDARGGRALISAPTGYWSTDPDGFASVVERQPDGSWSIVATLDPEPGVGFAGPVAIDGDTAVCGAQTTSAATVYDRQPDGSWSAVAQLAPDPSLQPTSPTCSSVDLDGDIAVVGSSSVWFGGDPTQDGWAGTFVRDANGTWSAGPAFFPAPTSGTDGYANAVAVAGQDVYVGEPLDKEGACAWCGSVWVHRVCDGCAVPFGAGSDGCYGPHEFTATSPPVIGWTLDLTVSGAPGGPSLGFVALGDAADPLGLDPLGVGLPLHIDLLATSFLLTFPVDGGDGTPTLSLAVPDDPALIDLDLVAQAFWVWAGCGGGAPPFISASPGLALRIERTVPGSLRRFVVE